MHPVPGTITDPTAAQILDGRPGPSDGQILNLAKALAAVVHAGQSRKGSGEPYFNHLARVAERVVGWRAKTIAYLHDTIEDTLVGTLTLKTIGFPDDIVDDVVALSRGGNETYKAFITRTIRDGSDDALRVKLSDLQDNLTDPWASETKLAQRYIPAAHRVAEELERRKNA